MKKKIIAISIITAMVVCNSMTVLAADKWSGDKNSTTYTIGTDGNNADTVVNSDEGQKNVNGTYVVGDGVTDMDGDGVPDTDEDKTTPGKDTTLDQDENGTITIPEGATFSVNIVWGDMNFKYDAGDTYWDPQAHAYKEDPENPGSWSPVTPSTGNKIEVTNNSNVGILAKVTYAPDTTSGIYNSVTGGIYSASTDGTQLTGTRSYQGANETITNAFVLPNSVNYKTTTTPSTEQSAYLQLKNSPSKSWTNNTKIGTVTIAIEYNLDAVPKP